MPSPAPLTEVTRTGRVESVHLGSLAVIAAEQPTSSGETWLSFGEPAAPTYARSAIKAFQALPLIDRGAHLFDRQELAVMVASHDGTPQHERVVERLLARGGFTVNDLRCGPHQPFDRDSRLELLRQGRPATRLHNNCSGKHAGFLLHQQALGAPPESYLDVDGACQRAIAAVVANYAQVDRARLWVGTDGCGAPSYWLPLQSMAAMFARYAAAGDPECSDLGAASCREIQAAVSEQPVLLSGARRFCAALVNSAPGMVFPKNGAEGVYVVGVRGEGSRPPLGIAVKVGDGAERGTFPVIVAVLERLGVLRGSRSEALQRFAAPMIGNTCKETVGEVRLSPECRMAIQRLPEFLDARGVSSSAPKDGASGPATTPEAVEGSSID